MPSLIGRIVARVSALFPEDWKGNAGQRFRQTIHEVVGPHDLTSVAAEGAKRLAVGAVSRDHAEAVKNYADEEHARIETELMKRTLDARARQEDAKADQEETRARTMRWEELLGRLKLFDEFQKHDAVPVWDRNGNIQILKAPAGFDWEEARARLFRGDEILLPLMEGTPERRDQ